MQSVRNNIEYLFFAYTQLHNHATNDNNTTNIVKAIQYN